MLAAIVFLACRHTGNARTFKEICAVVPQASVKVCVLLGGGARGGGGEIGGRQVGSDREGGELRLLAKRCCPCAHPAALKLPTSTASTAAGDWAHLQVGGA